MSNQGSGFGGTMAILVIMLFLIVGVVYAE